jgi:hypothetical protein
MLPERKSAVGLVHVWSMSGPRPVAISRLARHNPRKLSDASRVPVGRQYGYSRGGRLRRRPAPRLPHAMAAFVTWLAPHMDGWAATLRHAFDDARGSLRDPHAAPPAHWHRSHPTRIAEFYLNGSWTHTDRLDGADTRMTAQSRGRDRT